MKQLLKSQHSWKINLFSPPESRFLPNFHDFQVLGRKLCIFSDSSRITAKNFSVFPGSYSPQDEKILSCVPLYLFVFVIPVGIDNPQIRKIRESHFELALLSSAIVLICGFFHIRGRILKVSEGITSLRAPSFFHHSCPDILKLKLELSKEIGSKELLGDIIILKQKILLFGDFK